MSAIPIITGHPISNYTPIPPRLPIAPGSYQEQFQYYGAYPYAFFKENVENAPRTLHPAYMYPAGQGAQQVPGPISSGRIYNDPRDNFFNLFLNTINSMFWPTQNQLLPDIRRYGFQYNAANSINFLPKPTQIPRIYNNRPAPPQPGPYTTFGTHYPYTSPRPLPGLFYRYY